MKQMNDLESLIYDGIISFLLNAKVITNKEYNELKILN